MSVLVKILVLSHSEYDQEVSDQASGKEVGFDQKLRAEASQWLKNSRCAKWLQAEEAPFPLLSSASPSLISQVQPAALPVDAIENNKHIQKKTKVQIKRQIYKEKKYVYRRMKNIRKGAEIQRKVHLMSDSQPYLIYTYFVQK